MVCTPWVIAPESSWFPEELDILAVALLADESDLLSFAPVLPHEYTLAVMAVSCFLELVSQSTGELGSLSLAKTKMGDWKCRQFNDYF